MVEKTFTIGQAAEWLRRPGETHAIVAAQLGRFRQSAYVRTRGQFGYGKTAAHVFHAADLAVAKLCRSLIAVGVRDEDVMRAASAACYDLPANCDEPDGLTGIESALDSPSGSWSLFVFLADQPDGTQRVFGEVRRVEPDFQPAHPAIDLAIEVPMRWLPDLAQMRERG